jgi:methionine-R-sulfoxide reductase
MTKKIAKPEDEWRKQLTPEQYHVTRERGTERAFTGKYWDTKTQGTYKCICCGEPLFSSESKFDSGCGWPSFFVPLTEQNVTELADNSYGMRRTEVRCSKCDAHLGHVFEDGPQPTGLRYCINSASIDLDPKETK